MAKSFKDRSVEKRPRGASRKASAPLSGSNKAEVENVEYFLKALSQISLALNAMGYTAEGEALAQVKADLRKRIFSIPEKKERLPGICKVLH
jgi:hypothetical protein